MVAPTKSPAEVIAGVYALTRTRHTSRDFDEPTRRSLPVGEYLLLALIVGVAFALRYHFNFVELHPNNYGSCDASEYLRNAGALLNLQNIPVDFWHNAWRALTGSATPEQLAAVKADLEPLKGLYISGPVFPLFLAASYAFSFTQFDMLAWGPPVFANCILSALTCLFIALAGSHAFNKQTGFLAGTFAALYPAFIINSGRLYSETFAAFLLSFIIFVTVKNFGSESGVGSAFGTALINGASAAALQFTRSAMSVVSLMLVPITLFQQGIQKGIVALIGLLIGFAIIATPWLVFQKLAFGSASLIVDRVGHYNFFVGNNIDTLGWLSFPYPDGRGTNEKPIIQLAKESVARGPVRWLKLMQDKPLRLFSFPWNDFRTPLGPLTFQSQVLIHQALLLLAAIGIALGFAAGQRQTADSGYERSATRTRGNGAKMFILFVLLIHCAYLLFITVPRYNLTAIPELLIFSAAGITATAQLMQSRKGLLPASTIALSAILLYLLVRLPFVPMLAALAGAERAGIGLGIEHLLIVCALSALAISLWIGINRLTMADGGEIRSKPGKLIAHVVVIILFAIALPELGLPAAANGRWYEWQYKALYPQMKVVQTFKLPPDFQKNMIGRQTYLLADFEGLSGLNGYKVSVNGKTISAPAIPSIALCDDFTRFQTVKDNETMREGEWVFDVLSQSSGVRPSALRQWFLIPLPKQTPGSDGKLEVAIEKADGVALGRFFGTYPISNKTVSIPNPVLYSWEKAFYGVENDHGFSDPRYDFKITSMAAQSTDKDLSSMVGKQAGRFNLHLIGGPRNAFNDKIYTVEQTPPPPDTVQSLAQAHGNHMTLLANQKISLTLPAIPPYSPQDLWLLRIKGKAMMAPGNDGGTLSLHLKAATADKVKSYVSPWAPSIDCWQSGWSSFDSAAPLQPSALGSAVQQVTLEGQASAPMLLDNLTLEVMRAPQNPLHPGNIIY